MPFGMLREEGAVSEMGSQTSVGVMVLLTARGHMALLQCQRQMDMVTVMRTVRVVIRIA